MFETMSCATFIPAVRPTLVNTHNAFTAAGAVKTLAENVQGLSLLVIHVPLPPSGDSPPQRWFQGFPQSPEESMCHTPSPARLARLPKGGRICIGKVASGSSARYTGLAIDQVPDMKHTPEIRLRFQARMRHIFPNSLPTCRSGTLVLCWWSISARKDCYVPYLHSCTQQCRPRLEVKDYNKQLVPLILGVHVMSNVDLRDVSSLVLTGLISRQRVIKRWKSQVLRSRVHAQTIWEKDERHPSS
ncbi:uncharacterized protein B0I36DRAFT_81836 [Microdochium trichocladiopsis]|uniref:Uncharacterized protein n=1 Tax=Microdochium trichocladiopsis TaxID=1682393 RepID=A0A9P8YCQ2_9PEZI|nr:uncharacterized protein B0I36DRAFT_81836 [Microdochium trichocladiopsis]KAH7034511.1 hypothetical protein B0I36DRAFT_81836 [Microdochium trichocladiopsis]